MFNLVRLLKTESTEKRSEKDDRHENFFLTNAARFNDIIENIKGVTFYSVLVGAIKKSK